MASRWKRILRLAALIALVALCVRPENARMSALNPGGPTILPDHRWAHFEQRPGGLASNDVWAIAVSGDAVWFGTDLGVSRYNGMWTDYAPSYNARAAGCRDDDAIDGTVETLTAGTTPGSIWAGAVDGDICKWDGEAWTQIANVSEPVLSVAECNAMLYAGTESGLYAAPLDGGEAVLALGDKRVHTLNCIDSVLYAGSDNGLWQQGDQMWKRIWPLDNRPAVAVYAIAETWADALALGTPDGVVILDIGAQDARLLPVRDELDRPALVRSLAYDGEGRLWAGTDGAGAYEFSALDSIAVIHGQADDANVTIRYVRDLAIDADGTVWFATPTGVYRYQVGMWRSDVQGESAADPRNHINDLLVARDGSLWIATGGGGVRMKKGLSEDETVYSVDEDVPSTVLVLEEDISGNIWAGTFYGLFQFAQGRWQWPAINADLPDLTITALLQEGPYLWIGTEKGLTRLDTRDNTLSHLPEFNGVSIEALALDGLERLWVGTKTEGAWSRAADGEWTQYESDPYDADAIPGDWIIGSGLAPDWRDPGDLWAIVFQNGLVHWDGAAWTKEDADNQLPDNLLWTLETEPDLGRLWIGSEGGVTRFDGRTWGTLSQDDGLQSASVYAIARDQDGGYWIGGATGLSYYRPDQTPPWVRIEPLSEKARINEAGVINTPVGEELVLALRAGDLQTLQQNLIIRQRLIGPGMDGSWQQQTAGPVAFTFIEPGLYEIQFMARDQSFNYSDVLRQPVNVYVPPPTVNVPGLGSVDPNTFRALMILGSISLLGTGYILFEVLQQRRRSIDALNRGFNPYISGEPVRRQEMFYGRRDLVQRIVDTLHNNSVMIYGERRIGKTTLLYQLAALLRDVDDPEYWFVPVYIDLEGTPESDFFHLLIEEIVHGIFQLPDADFDSLPEITSLQYRSMSAAAYDDRAFHRDLHSVIAALKEYGNQRHADKQLRLILLLDEMDVMSQYDSLIQQQLRRIFMREFASTVGAVVAGIRISKDWDRVESPWYNMFNEIALEPFTEDEAHALLIDPVDGYYQYDEDAIDFILEHSNGRPYRIQQYGLEAVNHMLADRRRKVTLEDALAAHQHIEMSMRHDSAKKPVASDTTARPDSTE